MSRIYLSPPHLSPDDARLAAEAIASGWIAPLGPNVDAFQAEFAALVGARHAVALSSGTAALHLALIAAGIGSGDDVLISSLTFVASVNPVRYVGATPIFVDSDVASWNVDAALVAETLADRARRNRLPKAFILVHLYGQCADIDPIRAACDAHGVILIEDAAEALGSTYKGRAPGNDGVAGAFSFNGNKIITTSGGGMFVTPDKRSAAHVLKLATQAREAAPHYEHAEIGFNYRLSNILAAIGRGQLRTLHDRVAARRRIFDRYVAALGDLPGVSFQPEASWGRHSRWLTVVEIDATEFGIDREQLRLALEADNIEARPVWKPMHLQPLYVNCEMIGGQVAERVFARGLCLPSGSNLSDADHAHVVAAIRAAHAQAAARKRPTL